MHRATFRPLEQGHDVAGPFHVKLTPNEEMAYGAWNQIGFANAHLARLVSEAAEAQAFPLLLESNCYTASVPWRGCIREVRRLYPKAFYERVTRLVTPA